MAKQIPDLTQLLPADLTADDLLVVRDVSANKDKKIRVGDVTGMPAIGWIAALETWTFASYANGVGVVNIPSGGLTKYAVGNRVQFSQTTGGKKYAIVTGVTNTTLTLALLSGATLANEGIATPQYSTEYAPPTSDNVGWATLSQVTAVRRLVTAASVGTGWQSYLVDTTTRSNLVTFPASNEVKVLVGGVYSIGCVYRTASGSPSSKGLRVNVYTSNGAVRDETQGFGFFGNVNLPVIEISGTVKLVAGDVVKFYQYQDVNVTPTAESNMSSGDDRAFVNHLWVDRQGAL